jgi:hypothetical protein
VGNSSGYSMVGTLNARGLHHKTEFKLFNFLNKFLKTRYVPRENIISNHKRDNHTIFPTFDKYVAEAERKPEN